MGQSRPACRPVGALDFDRSPSAPHVHAQPAGRQSGFRLHPRKGRGLKPGYYQPGLRCATRDRRVTCSGKPSSSSQNCRWNRRLHTEHQHGGEFSGVTACLRRSSCRGVAAPAAGSGKSFVVCHCMLFSTVRNRRVPDTHGVGVGDELRIAVLQSPTPTTGQLPDRPHHSRLVFRRPAG